VTEGNIIILSANTRIHNVLEARLSEVTCTLNGLVPRDHVINTLSKIAMLWAGWEQAEAMNMMRALDGNLKLCIKVVVERNFGRLTVFTVFTFGGNPGGIRAQAA
jgi:hypothetical protein